MSSLVFLHVPVSLALSTSLSVFIAAKSLLLPRKEERMLEIVSLTARKIDQWWFVVGWSRKLGISLFRFLNNRIGVYFLLFRYCGSSSVHHQALHQGSPKQVGLSQNSVGSSISLEISLFSLSKNVSMLGVEVHWKRLETLTQWLLCSKLVRHCAPSGATVFRVPQAPLVAPSLRSGRYSLRPSEP